MKVVNGPLEHRNICVANREIVRPVTRVLLPAFRKKFFKDVAAGLSAQRCTMIIMERSAVEGAKSLYDPAKYRLQLTSQDIRTACEAVFEARPGTNYLGKESHTYLQILLGPKGDEILKGDG